MTSTEIILIIYCGILTIVVMFYFSKIASEIHMLVSSVKIGEIQYEFITKQLDNMEAKQVENHDKVVHLESDMRLTRKELETLNNWAKFVGYGADKMPNTLDVKS